jgi:tetrahydromethanopterin S-methyltransferase subunit B
MEPLDTRVARLEERLGAMQTDVTEIKTDTKAQTTLLNQLVAVDNQRKGAARFAKGLMGIGSGSGVVALIAWIAEHFRP